ncbi:response regulator [Okeania sp. SIO1I7]|uniref:response regulator n=1 Tax=Okeania sp. SIO1I7 TaxID=2607772 RepID=UPI0013F74F34|nr:response regulator [Okeania sp. SIO1I7]NET30168.1 response regulator [Okeania sp. SIO1I7]
MSSRKKLKPKILVVDDESDNLDLLYRTFYRDYKVLRAKSGLEALEILETSEEVAVIISDQRMPKMSGTEFLSITANQYPDTIRILLTGFTDVEDLVEAINSGKVFKYLTKPWNAEELKGLVKQAVDTHNVLKSHTDELRRALQQESLLYAVTNTIRSAPNYRQMLQRIVETIGQMFEVSLAVCRPFQDSYREDEWFIYQNQEENSQKLANTDSTDIPEEIFAHILWQTTDVEIILDVQTDERFQGESRELQQRRQAYQAANIRSSLIVPLFSRLDLIAVLALHQCEEIRNWQDHEVQLLITVADQAALALSQARAYEQLSSIAQREALVNTITTAIRSSLNPQDIFAAITQELGKALKVDGCVLSLWTETDEYVQCVGLYDAQIQASISTTNEASTLLDNYACRAEIPDNDRSSTAIELPQSFAPIRSNPILMELLKTKKTIAVCDLNRNPEFNESQLSLRSNARALMVVPLTVDGQIIGSISLRHNDDRHQWQASEIELAEVVASQAAIAVQQSSLYQTTRQQAERLIEADRLKTEFFQNISHEFRTPLTLTIGLLEEAVNSSRDLPLEQGAIALRNSRRLLRLVNQLLDLQRIDAGRMQPSFQPCNLVAFCRNIVESFTPYCQKKQLHLVTEFSENCPLVYLDIERFDKVIYNLLSNAMKFTPAGGTITISVEPVGENCLLKVQDSGIGIRQEQIPFLFERFRQAEGSANRSYEGSGIGLALVKELVELHHGQVNVESVYGQGATFEVWLQTGNSHLPTDRVVEKTAEFNASKLAVEFADIEAELEEAKELQAVDQAENIAQVNGNDVALATILVVDDNPDLRSYVSRIMRKSNLNVMLARNGAEGFEISQTYHPHLIITDLMMPIVSGLDLIKMIREEKELRGTPIILLTAKADEDTRIEGVERGADAYLSKPFNERELLAEVNNLLALKENERRVQELNSYLTESVLRRFLPPEMVQRAAQGDLALDLRPEPKLVTVLFSDIVGFTQMSNILQARRIAELLNEYLTEMTKAIFANGGTVDKFVGDAVMAIYGSPEELTADEQVQRAVASARAMLKALDKLNERWQNLGLIGQNGASPVRFRCGIHQGNAVVGMFGGAERSDYTAIGPSVNIAARLQEAAEPNTILVSQTVANYVDSLEVKKYGYLKLKGIDEEILGFVVSQDSII